MLLELTGKTPLLMRNIRLADDQDPLAREIKKLTDKKNKKTEDDKREIDRLSFAGALYYDTELGPYLPAENIFRCLMEAGAVTRSGKKVERGVIFESTKAPLEYPGPRDVESLWGDGQSPFVDRRTVVVSRQRVPRVRPIFTVWSATFSMETDPQVIDRDEFEDIVSRAGRMVGIGDYRRFYGRFDGKVTG